MKHMLVLSVGLAFVVAAIVTGCGGQPQASGGGQSEDSQDQAAAAETGTAPATPQASAQPEDMPAPADEMSEDAADKVAGRPSKIDDVTIVGTVWKRGDFKFSFEADGVVKLNDAIPGTWKIEGNNLTVSVMGQTQQAQIEGNKLMHEGTELEFVQ